MILYGEPVAREILAKTKKYIETRNIKTSLAIICNRDDKASLTYVKNKVNACQKVGVKPLVLFVDDKTEEKDYLKFIDDLAKDNSVAGIIAQMPLPKKVSVEKVINAIPKEKDIDGFRKDSLFSPCTPSGIISLIDFYKGKDFYSGKNAVVIGRSDIVGKPIAKLLLDRDCSVTICHSKTPKEELVKYLGNADIIVSAVGKPYFVKDIDVKKGAVIIDVGINRLDDKLVGDVFTSDYEKTCDITPVPKGVGVLTVATLISRIPLLYRLQQNKNKKVELEK